MDSASVLIIISSAAFFLPILAQRFKVPAVVVEIAFGILVGPAVLGFLHGDELINFLAELGFFLLMFLSGFEIDFGKLQRKGWGEITTALAVFGMTLLFAGISARLLGYGPFMTFILATTSVGIVVPTLRSAKIESTDMGQAALIAAILADFLTLLGVTIFALVREHGGGPDLLKVPLLFIIMLTVLLTLRRAAWWFPERFAVLFSDDDPDEMGIRASFAMMLAFVGLSELLDVEPILGAFLAGSLFALVFPNRGRLEQKLTGFSYGFLIPIFFINVGVRFDLEAFLEIDILIQAGLLFLVAVMVKVVPSFLYLARGLTIRECLSMGTLISARLSLIIAVAALGVELGLIGPRLQSAVIALALVTTTLAPTVFKQIAPTGGLPVRSRP